MNGYSKIPFFVRFITTLIILTEAQAQQSFENNPYWHREILDSSGKYQLEWLVDWSKERVEFNVTVATKGYVAFGLARNGKMEGADIVIGGVAPNGSAYFSDRHAIGNQEPVEDGSQDWVLHSAWESATHTFLSFSRPFDTCDDHDIPINDDVLYVLWAYGARDSVTYHLENRGSYLTYLRDPDVTPRSIHESNRNTSSGVVERIGDARRWGINVKFHIPPKRTTYWCTVHKFSQQIRRKQHLIGYNVRINPEARQHMHHMLMYRCNLPLDLSPAILFEPFVGKGGQECYSFGQLMGPILTQLCTELKIGFAIGGRPTFFPDHVGIPMGETNRNEYYLWQVHYDNPDLRSDINSDIQLDIYYTSKLRRNDGGILSLGHDIPASPSILLPPGETDHKFFGHCSPSCTRKMLSPQGIKLTAGFLHTHMLGRRARIQHFRNGKELPWILNDDNYKFAFQPTRLLREDVSVLPGDQLSVQCHYDTTSLNKTTVGGYGTDQEMCKTFLVYHTVLDNYFACRSAITSSEYMMRYLAGTRNVTWDQATLEYKATSPPHLAGMTLSSISDSQHVNWDNDLREQLRKDHITHPQQTVCPNLREVVVTSLLGVRVAPDYVSIPVGAQEYVPPEKCSVPTKAPPQMYLYS